MDGFINEDSRMGMAVTQDSAAQLNRIVVQEFLAHSIPAVSFYFSNSMVTDRNQAKHWCEQVLEEYLAKGMFPITGGDVLVDSTNGCTIWSTEKILGYLAEYFSESPKYRVQKIIHVTEVDGILDASGQVIPEITSKNSAEVEKLIGTTKGFDVTGGMGHKLEESMKLAQKGMEVAIISGLKEDTLYHSLIGDSVVGTTIRN
jgi:isopentenyl phosphate kinase